MPVRTIEGAGIGLRTPHAKDILSDPNLDIPWLEILADNWLESGGLNRRMLLALSERFDTVLHGVGLSLGSTCALDFDYLKKVKTLKQETGSVWYSEHASFSAHQGLYFPDLLPLPFTEEAVQHLSHRISQVQDFLGEQILLENISAYVECPMAEMSEAEFIRELSQRADCGLLLDINNVFVSSTNFEQSADDFLSIIPVERIRQIHLAGFEDKGNYLLDAHNNPVAEQVWRLFKRVIQENGPIPSMIEWDNDVPSLDRLLQERSHAEQIMQSASRSDFHAA